jgi:hypothetical protein
MTDDELVDAFERCTLPRADWTHRAHVRVATQRRDGCATASSGSTPSAAPCAAITRPSRWRDSRSSNDDSANMGPPIRRCSSSITAAKP